MIPFLDVAFGQFMKTVFPDYPVVFTPVDQSRQSLARLEQEKKVGIPGLAYWRVDCRKDKRIHSLPQAQLNMGFNAGRQPGLYGIDTNFQMVNQIRVRAIYTVTAWARELSDLNNIERSLWYCDVYRCITATIKANDPNTNSYSFTSSYKFPFEGSDPKYKTICDEKTGRVTWVGLEKDFEVSAPWMRTHDAPYIDEMILKVYQGISSGEPLPKNLLDEIHFDLTQEAIFHPE